VRFSSRQHPPPRPPRGRKGPDADEACGHRVEGAHSPGVEKARAASGPGQGGRYVDRGIRRRWICGDGVGGGCRWQRGLASPEILRFAKVSVHIFVHI
jgi:hypothetical protein